MGGTRPTSVIDRRLAVAATLLVAGVTIAALLQGTSPAAFPGKNGKIAFDSDRGGDRDIFTMNPNGSGQTNLTRNRRIDDLRPVWNPGGGEIAFWSDRSGNHDVHTMNADGSGVRRLTDSPGLDGDPSFSPARILAGHGGDQRSQVLR